MSVQVTIQDTFNMTLEDLISIAPNSKGAKAIKDLKAERDTLKAENEALREAIAEKDRHIDKLAETGAIWTDQISAQGQTIEQLREALCAYQREEKASMAKLQAEQIIDTETHVATDSTVVVDKALIQDLIDYAEKHKAAEPWMVDKMKAMLKASEEDA